MPYYWLSFCDPDKPPGGQFLGVCIVQANSFTEAMLESWRLKCNPGGEVSGTLLEESCPVVPELVNRLLTLRELADRDMIDAKVH